MGIKTPEARATALSHASSPASEVRAAALILLADFPDAQARAQWQLAATSADATVRSAVAEAVAKARDGAMAGTLNYLIDDDVPAVREAAVRGLLVLPKASARLFWNKRRTHKEYWPVFINALAAGTVGIYRADLARSIGTIPGILPQPSLDNVTLGGQNVIYTSWHLLFEDLRKMPSETQLANYPPIQSAWLALEMNPHPDWSEPEQLYEWYRRLGLEERAQNYRQRAEADYKYLAPVFQRADEAVKRGQEWNH